MYYTTNITTFSYQQKISMQNPRAKLLSILKDCVTTTKVTLTSGKKSNFYINCKEALFQSETLNLIGDIVYPMLLKIEKSKSTDNDFLFKACGGMELGAIPIICALSIAARQKKRTLNAVAIRKNPKGHGMDSFLEGSSRLKQQDNIILLEDVVTTGMSTILAAKRLRQHGFIVNDVISLVDRKEDGELNLKKDNINLHSIYNVFDFTTTCQQDSC